MIGPTSTFPRIQPIVDSFDYPHVSEATRKNPWGWYPGFGFYKYRTPRFEETPRKRGAHTETIATNKFLDPIGAYALGFGNGLQETPPSVSGDNPIHWYASDVINSDWITLEDAAYLGYLTHLTPQLDDGDLSLEQKRALVCAVSEIALKYTRPGTKGRDQLERHLAGEARPGDVGGRTSPSDGAADYLDCLVSDHVGPGVENPRYTSGVKRIGGLAHHLVRKQRPLFHRDMVAVYEKFALTGMSID